ncbi:hypothetical protein NKDENANG_00392 [Candidatus Entotheonellaceae bacterium PAL068K]
MPYTPVERTSHLRSFEQIRVGDEAELTHGLRQDDVDTFARLTGDFNPLHLDEAFARRMRFRKPVVYGMLSASFISTLIGMLLPGRGALWTSQTLEFLHPAYVGDTLRVRAQVKQKSPATRMIVMEMEITNQHHQKLIVGEAAVKLPEPKEEDTVGTQASQIILVTGGSGGIGAAVARRLAEQRHAIVVHYVQAAAAAAQVVDDIVQAGGRAIAVQADIANEAEVEKLFIAAEETLGFVQAVVHCASPTNTLHPFDELDWTSVQHHLDVQVKGAFNCAKIALSRMAEVGSGALLFMGSVAADGTPPAQQTDYVVAKAALTTLARCLALEYGHQGIRVNVVAPGMTWTDMITHLPDKTKMLTRVQTPLRRLAEPIDIANVVAFLLSPEAQHITGETIRVNGGTVML